MAQSTPRNARQHPSRFYHSSKDCGRRPTDSDAQRLAKLVDVKIRRIYTAWCGKGTSFRDCRKLPRMRIAIGADHGGYGLKAQLVEFLEGLGHEVMDVGAQSLDPSDDYPDFAKAVADGVARQQASRGIMVCGSGVGASVAANKVRGVRASVCHDTYSAHQGVEHDDLNVLCLGDRIVGAELAKELVIAFVSAQFSGEERHQRRLGKVLSMEADFQ